MRNAITWHASHWLKAMPEYTPFRHQVLVWNDDWFADENLSLAVSPAPDYWQRLSMPEDAK